jgi:hypothetical protein
LQAATRANGTMEARTVSATVHRWIDVDALKPQAMERAGAVPVKGCV